MLLSLQHYVEGGRHEGDKAVRAPAIKLLSGLARVQVMTWELLTQTKFYGAGADMAAVIDALTGKTPLPSERELSPDVHRGLANPTFRTTVVNMLSRDPARRPSMAELVHSWTSLMMQQTTSGPPPPPQMQQ